MGGVGIGFIGGAAARASDSDKLVDMQDAHTELEAAALGTAVGGGLLIAGGGLLVAGVVLLAITPSSDESPPGDVGTGVAWRPLVGPGGVGLAVTF